MDRAKAARELLTAARDLVGARFPTKPNDIAKSLVTMALNRPRDVGSREWDKHFEMDSGDEVVKILRKVYQDSVRQNNFAIEKALRDAKRYLPESIFR